MKIWQMKWKSPKSNWKLPRTSCQVSETAQNCSALCSHAQCVDWSPLTHVGIIGLISHNIPSDRSTVVRSGSDVIKRRSHLQMNRRGDRPTKLRGRKNKPSERGREKGEGANAREKGSQQRRRRTRHATLFEEKVTETVSSGTRDWLANTHQSVS